MSAQMVSLGKRFNAEVAEETQRARSFEGIGRAMRCVEVQGVMIEFAC